VGLLGRAYTYASSGVGRGELLSDLQLRQEIAHIQLHIQHALRAPTLLEEDDTEEKQLERRQAQEKLDTGLFDISDLFNNYAKKYHLWESCLRILKFSAYNDHAKVQQYWQHLIASCLGRFERSEYRDDRLASTVISAGKALYPSELTFPTKWLCDFLEHTAVEYKRWSFDLVLNIMREIGVTYPHLFDVYVSLAASSTSWQGDPEARLHILKVIYTLLLNWMKTTFSPRGTTADRHEFRLKNVDNYVEQYIVDLGQMRSEDTEEVEQNFRDLLNDLRSALHKKY